MFPQNPENLLPKEIMLLTILFMVYCISGVCKTTAHKLNPDCCLLVQSMSKEQFSLFKIVFKNSRVILHNMPKSCMKLKFHCPYIQSYWNSAILIYLHSAIHWGRCYRHKDEKENTISGLPAFSSHNTFPSVWPTESI